MLRAHNLWNSSERVCDACPAAAGAVSRGVPPVWSVSKDGLQMAASRRRGRRGGLARPFPPTSSTRPMSANVQEASVALLQEHSCSGSWSRAACCVPAPDAVARASALLVLYLPRAAWSGGAGGPASLARFGIPAQRPLAMASALVDCSWRSLRERASMTIRRVPGGSGRLAEPRGSFRPVAPARAPLWAAQRRAHGQRDSLGRPGGGGMGEDHAADAPGHRRLPAAAPSSPDGGQGRTPPRHAGARTAGPAAVAGSRPLGEAPCRPREDQPRRGPTAWDSLVLGMDLGGLSPEVPPMRYSAGMEVRRVQDKGYLSFRCWQPWVSKAFRAIPWVGLRPGTEQAHWEGSCLSAGDRSF